MGETGIKILKRFIVFEGIDGTGTTTQLKALGASLERAGIPHRVTCEPTELPFGKLVRSVLRGETEARPETLARLFSADRNEHLFGRDGIVEAIDRGETVVCDRYILSSLAYQGAACGLALPRLLNQDFPLPELLVYFDLDPELSMRRVDSRGAREIFEHLAVQRQVRSAYEKALSEFSASAMKIARVDASLSIEEVGLRIRSLVSEQLRARLTE